MGTFLGHLDEGIVFIILALWWIYNMTKNYFKSVEEGKPYRSHISYPSTVRGRTLPLEIGFKVGFPILGFVFECLSNKFQFVGADGNFQHGSSMQHMTIFFLFTLHGVSDLVDYLKLSAIRDMKYVTAGFAFAWYGGAFYFHSEPNTGKSPMELIVHRLPVTLMFITVLTYILEATKRDWILPQIVRCHMVLVLGTWFSHISFILYTPSIMDSAAPNPAWVQNNMTNVHFMVTAFGIHLILNLLIIMAAFYIAESYRKCARLISGVKGENSSRHYEKVKLIDAEDPVFGDNEM